MSKAEIPGGYILQPRKFDMSEAARMPPVTREVWLYILRYVNHSDNGEFKRGQNFMTIKQIQEALSWFVGFRKMEYSKTQVAKSLRRLREGSMIATTKATRGFVVTVCNYDYYQDTKNYEGYNEGITKVSRRKRGDHTINKNVKNDNNKEITTYPDWLDVNLFSAFEQMRNKIKKPITSQLAYSRLFNSLDRIIKKGYTQEEVVGEAVEKNWLTFYEPKNKPKTSLENF